MEGFTHAFGQFTHAIAIAFYILLSVIGAIGLLIGHLFTKWYYKWKISRGGKPLFSGLKFWGKKTPVA